MDDTMYACPHCDDECVCDPTVGEWIETDEAEL